LPRPPEERLDHIDDREELKQANGDDEEDSLTFEEFEKGILSESY
jgi:hypothetical protein